MSDDDQPRLWGKAVTLDEDCPRGHVHFKDGKLHVHPDDYEWLGSE